MVADPSHNPKALVFHELEMRLQNTPLPVFQRIVTWVKPICMKWIKKKSPGSSKFPFIIKKKTNKQIHVTMTAAGPKKMWASANESSELGDENQNKMWLLTVSHLDGVTKAH